MAITTISNGIENSNAEVNKVVFSFNNAADVQQFECHGYNWTTVTLSANPSNNNVGWEGSTDGITWSALSGYPANGVSYSGQIYASGGTYLIYNSGYSFIRLKFYTYFSGSTLVFVVQDKNCAGLTPQAIVFGGGGIGQVIDQSCIYYNETTAPLGIGATYTGTSRYTGVGPSQSHGRSSFNAVVFADQAGSTRIEMSTNATTWYRATDNIAVTANIPVNLSVPVNTNYYRIIMTNGAVTQTSLMVSCSFTKA